jgi:hypothetical protein
MFGAPQKLDLWRAPEDLGFSQHSELFCPPDRATVHRDCSTNTLPS